MRIVVRIDELMARRKMSVNRLAEEIGISPTNLSLLKNGHVRGVRFNTLLAICRALDCRPGDILDIEGDDT